jgi:uncharacterized membrane protein
MSAPPHANAQLLHFDAVIRPHRSLGPGGFRLVMLLAVAICSAGAIAFASLGAWPVSGFFGLDVLLLFGALQLSFRAAAREEEAIRLTDTELSVRRRRGNQISNWRFNPYWVRLRHDEAVDGGTTLSLASHGRALTIARFLCPEERRDLWQRLDAALADCRGHRFGS